MWLFTPIKLLCYPYWSAWLTDFFWSNSTVDISQKSQLFKVGSVLRQNTNIFEFWQVFFCKFFQEKKNRGKKKIKQTQPFSLNISLLVHATEQWRFLKPVSRFGSNFCYAGDLIDEGILKKSLSCKNILSKIETTWKKIYFNSPCFHGKHSILVLGILQRLSIRAMSMFDNIKKLWFCPWNQGKFWYSLKLYST